MRLPRPVPFSSSVAMLLLVGACVVPSQQTGAPLATANVSPKRAYPPVAGLHAWEGGQQVFERSMGVVAQQYAIALADPGAARDAVTKCYRHAFTPNLYIGAGFRNEIRACLGLDYMFHRDQRTSARAREATRSPYFNDDSFTARWTAMMPWGGFATPDDMFVYARFAWSYIEPKTINYQNVIKTYHRASGLDG